MNATILLRKVRNCVMGATPMHDSRSIDKSAELKILFFLFLNQNVCCRYSKEPTQCDSSFEHP